MPINMHNMKLVFSDYYNNNLTIEEVKSKYRLSPEELDILNQLIQEELGAKNSEETGTYLPGNYNKVITYKDKEIRVSHIQTFERQGGGYVEQYQAADGSDYFIYFNENGEQQKIFPCWDMLTAEGDWGREIWSDIKEGDIFGAIGTICNGAKTDPTHILNTGVAPCPQIGKMGILKNIGNTVKNGKNVVNAVKSGENLGNAVKNLKNLGNAVKNLKILAKIDKSLTITTNVDGILNIVKSKQDNT